MSSQLQKEVQLTFVHLSPIFYVPPADVNDNVPFFTSSIYEASVTEGAESGALVLQVSATDLDLGLNGKVNCFYLKMFSFIKPHNLMSHDGATCMKPESSLN